MNRLLTIPFVISAMAFCAYSRAADEAPAIKVWVKYQTVAGEQRGEGNFQGYEDGQFVIDSGRGTPLKVQADDVLRMRFGQKPEWWDAAASPLKTPPDTAETKPAKDPVKAAPENPKEDVKKPPDDPRKQPRDDPSREALRMQAAMEYRAMREKKRRGELDEYLKSLNDKLAASTDRKQAQNLLREFAIGTLVQEQTLTRDLAPPKDLTPAEQDRVKTHVNDAVRNVRDEKVRQQLTTDMQALFLAEVFRRLGHLRDAKDARDTAPTPPDVRERPRPGLFGGGPRRKIGGPGDGKDDNQNPPPAPAPEKRSADPSRGDF
jgi:hypothetical protein